MVLRQIKQPKAVAAINRNQFRNISRSSSHTSGSKGKRSNRRGHDDVSKPQRKWISDRKYCKGNDSQGQSQCPAYKKK